MSGGHVAPPQVMFLSEPGTVDLAQRLCGALPQLGGRAAVVRLPAARGGGAAATAPAAAGGCAGASGKQAPAHEGAPLVAEQGLDVGGSGAMVAAAPALAPAPSVRPSSGSAAVLVVPPPLLLAQLAVVVRRHLATRPRGAKVLVEFR